MSWQAYVDDSLVGSGSIEAGAICGHDGTLWAASRHLALPAEHVRGLVGAFSDPAGVREKGLVLGSSKYIVIKSDDRSIYGKQGTGGICCVRTRQTVLVGKYEAPATPGAASKVVEALADYLISVGY
jgi:profilin